jgi:predicted transcriptional regulator
MNNLSSSVNSGLEWRRSKVQELASQGYNQSEISRILQISQPTINRDIAFLRQQAKDNIKTYIDERLPEEYERCFVGLTAILREAWNTANQSEDRREKIQALSLAKECYSMKLDLLTNATVIDDAIRFVSNRTNEMLRPSSNSIEEHDYDEDKDQLEEQEQQEEETGKIATTTNLVF